MKPIIHSVKHYIQFPIDQIPTGTRQNIVLVEAVESTSANLATEVEEGTSIKAVFIELWLQNSANLGEEIVIIERVDRLGSGATFTNMGNLFAYINKKNVFFTHQGLATNDGIGNPIRPVYMWVKIPKGKQRFGLGDKLVLSIANVSANDLNRCGFSTYKEYS